MTTEIDLADKVFKDPKGRWLTQSLFKETNFTGKFPALFSLVQREHTDDHLSVHKLYMEADDPTEYVVAMKMLGSYEHWQLLCSLEFFKPHLEVWRAEKAAAIRSLAVAEMRQIASGGTAAALAANKWLAESDLLDTSKPFKRRAGRPRKIQKDMFEDSTGTTLAEDAARIGL